MNIIEIFYPEHNLRLDLSEAIEWRFANKELIECKKEEAICLLVSFPERLAANGETVLGGTPELYYAPGHALIGYVTQESWDQL